MLIELSFKHLLLLRYQKLETWLIGRIFKVQFIIVKDVQKKKLCFLWIDK
jgi:hypothetical protein